MNAFYQAVCDMSENEVYRTALILEGPDKGERALYLNGRPNEGAIPYFEKCRETVNELSARGYVRDEERLLFIENIDMPAEMVICGGGYVSLEVVHLAKRLGFHITVFEDRPLFAEKAREAGAHKVLCDTFENNLKEAAGGSHVYFLILTRGHRYDMVCLEELLKKPCAYIGMIGSRGRVAKAKQTLLDKGYEKEKLDTLHSPIGLSIGAETPAEIAVSIMAEIIAVRSQLKRGQGYTREMRGALKESGEKIMATIIERHGSAPRETGTKMMILDDGRCIGTIGGGCAENNIIMKARLMLQEKQKDSETVMVDMTGREAEDEGMVCGGRIKVYMERIS